MKFSFEVVTLALMSSAFTFAEPPAHAEANVKFVDLDSSSCSSSVSSRITAMYLQKRNTYDQCTLTSAYKIFPYPGYLPSTEQFQKICSSSNCITFINDLNRLDLPECQLGGVAVKSFFETMATACADLGSGGNGPINGDQMLELMKWRHDRNANKAKGLPFDTDSATAKKFDIKLQTGISATPGMAPVGGDDAVASDATEVWKKAGGSSVDGGDTDVESDLSEEGSEASGSEDAENDEEVGEDSDFGDESASKFEDSAVSIGFAAIPSLATAFLLTVYLF